MLEVLRKFRRTKIYYYPRPATTVAVATVAVVTTLIARGLLPRSARPGGLWVAGASFFAYGVLRLDNHMHYSKRFKHAYIDQFGGDVDNAQTWILARLSGGGALAFGQMLRRLFCVSRSTET